MLHLQSCTPLVLAASIVKIVYCQALNERNSLCYTFSFSSGRYCMQTYCDSLPCKNGGVCRLVTPSSSGLQQRQRGHRSRPLPSGRRYECECPPGFGGPTCERRVHPCQSYRPCSGNGICIVDKKAKDNREGYRCQCHLWWTGKIFFN